MYKSLLDYCKTESEFETVEAVIKYGSPNKAAPHLGVNERTVRRHLERLRKNSKTPGEIVGRMDEVIPSPFVVKGTSTLYDAQTGEAKIAWIKTDTDKEQKLQMLEDAVLESLSDYKPMKKVKAPRKCNEDLLAIYPMGDPHMGMYAWSKETGQDFDCDIAEKDLRKAMAYLVAKAPPAKQAIILNLGDFFHSDNQNNRTARAGNALDVDSRWARVLQIGITVMMDLVNMALEKHETVLVKNNIGNHDDHTSQMLSICMMHAFKDNPRVTISEPASKFLVHEFGVNMIFSTHGDMVKPRQCSGMIAKYYPEIWGRTIHRLALFGHFHHEDRREENGVLVEIFNTLASADAWHYNSGYGHSKKNQKLIVLHREEGEIERFTFNLPNTQRGQ